MPATTDIPALLAEIRARRETNTTQALQLLALADAAPATTDTETRLASLRMAARQLTDDAVCAARCASIPGEKNFSIRHAKITRLALHLNGPRVRSAHYATAIPLIPALLATLAEHTPEVVAAIEDVLLNDTDRDLVRTCLDAYLKPTVAPRFEILRTVIATETNDIATRRAALDKLTQTPLTPDEQTQLATTLQSTPLK